MPATEVQAPPSLPRVLDPRVERGARLLDQQYKDWAWDVNLDDFHLASCTRCVLGQLGWDNVTVPIEGHFVFAGYGRHGFWADDDADYPAMEQDWRLAILARRTGAMS